MIQNNATVCRYDQTINEFVEEIARVCHEVNRAICQAAGDNSQVCWNDAEEWQKISAMNGVKYRLENPQASAEDQHEKWMQDKVNDGWVYGPEKDPKKKTHPCLVSYEDLPFEQRVKDHAFSAVVASMSK